MCGNQRLTAVIWKNALSFPSIHLASLQFYLICLQMYLIGFLFPKEMTLLGIVNHI